MPPLVSIIIPCYNYAQYLAAAIESALAQTYRPIEVIVVDDGSTDGSREVAARYPVRLLSQPNQGSATATNNGVRTANGTYVVRLDADDVLYPAFLEETVPVLEAEPGLALVHTQAEYFGDRIGRVPFVPFDAESLAQGSYATCCSLIRRAAWDAVGGLDSRLPLCEDWDMWLAFAERGMTGVMIRKPLWGYRQHGPSTVRRTFCSRSDLAREYRLVSILQDNHPIIFAPPLLFRRLRAVPTRVASRCMGGIDAIKLIVLYSIMLARVASGRHRPGQKRRCSPAERS